MRAFTAARVRALEQDVMEVVGPDVLMQRAAAGLAHSAAAMLRSSGGVYGARVLVLVGPGNNGGDALFAGARLAGRGARVEVVRCLGEPHPAGLAALLAAGGRPRVLEGLDVAAGAYALVLDGILGIGGRPGLPDSLTPLLDGLARSGAPVLAVDLPSGVAADTGAVPGRAVTASRTVTFGALKACHLLQPALGRCGAVELVDIGLSLRDDADVVGMDLDDLARAWPYPDATSDKYSRGVVGVDTGSEQYPGAALMSTMGAVYAGAGMVRFLGPARPRRLIEAQLPNVVFSPGRVQAHLLGSGWGDRPDGAELIARAVDSGLPTVVDADGLRHLPERCPDTWLLTPHAGELARLVDRERSWVSEDPVRAARAGAEQTGATVLLKGASQVVVGPQVSGGSGEPARVALPGPAWTAQAGSGDVLGGVCATLLAAGLPPALAGQVGASVQAAAAAEHPGAVPPGELARSIGRVLGALERRAR